MKRIRTEKMRIAWDIRSEARAVFSRLAARDKSIPGILKRLEAGCPVSATCFPFENGAYFRLEGHARSFCLRTKEGGCVVFKGTEPMSRDAVTLWNQVRDRILANSKKLADKRILKAFESDDMGLLRWLVRMRI